MGTVKMCDVYVEYEHGEVIFCPNGKSYKKIARIINGIPTSANPEIIIKVVDIDEDLANLQTKQ